MQDPQNISPLKFGMSQDEDGFTVCTPLDAAPPDGHLARDKDHFYQNDERMEDHCTRRHKNWKGRKIAMDYLKILRENPDLADEFDSLFDFFLLDELSPRDDAEGRCTFSLPGMAFARDGSGGEYHLLEDGSIGYYSSEGEAGRLAESMDDLFSLLVSCICWHDCCDAKQYVDRKTLEEYGQRCRNSSLEDMDVDRWRRVSAALGIPTSGKLAPVLERFHKAAQRQPLYQCVFHEDDGSLTESYGLMFE